MLISNVAKAQQSKIYNSISAMYGYSKNRNFIGGGLNFGSKVNSSNGFGAGVELVHFDYIPSIYIPIYPDLRIFIPGKKSQTMVMIQPGYGIYNRTENGINKKGGFYFSGGIGGMSKKKPGFVVALRYCHYGFTIKDVAFLNNSNSSKTSVNGVSFSLGVSF